MKRKLLPFSPQAQLQQRLSKQCYWDEVEQTLWIDGRREMPSLGVIEVMGWDRMMLDSDPVPDYPTDLLVFEWSSFSQLSQWRKQIPKWVCDSCALFPSHQLTLLHYCGKYPQILELLDHAPLLAWRLVSSGLEEPEIVALLAGKRVDMAAQVGWPGKEETVKFLRNLRLRWINQEIAEQVEVCLMDEQRLKALQSLPRINSMALSLAARFPDLIGCRLHQALAQLPCRPMQCQSMVALLEDAYRLAEYLDLPESEVARIGDSRYLVEVTEIYQAWLETTISGLESSGHPADGVDLIERLHRSGEPFEKLTELGDWMRLSMEQQHAWITDYPKDPGTASSTLIAWLDGDKLWAALVDCDPQLENSEILRVRGLENGLPTSKQLADLHLWQATGRL